MEKQQPLAADGLPSQIPRLKRTGLYGYIDRIVAGEDAMKPDLESFQLAIGNTSKEDCIMIGDSITSDKLVAENAGIDCYIVDKEHNLNDLLQMIINSKNKTNNSAKKIQKNIQQMILINIKI